MKKLVFPKSFVRHPEEDFSDDGTRFRVYFYKDKLPLSVTNSERYGAFVDVRLDYLHIPYEVYKSDSKIANEFNGVSNVDMEKLISNCEYLLDKYVENPRHVTPAVPARTEEDLDTEIARIAQMYGFNVKTVSETCKKVHCLDGKVAKIYCSKHDENWDAWEEKRIVKCECRFEIYEVKKVYGYAKLEEYEGYANDILNTVALVKELNKLDTTYERVHVL